MLDGSFEELDINLDHDESEDSEDGKFIWFFEIILRISLIFSLNKK